MILKRPFAFFIKHFRIIHFILAVITAYLAYNTANIISFFSEYMQATATLVDKEVTVKLFPLFIFILIFIALIISTIVLVLMKWKQKQILFYVINIVNNVYIWGIYIYSRIIVKELETAFVQVRTLKLVHDLLLIGLVIQSLSLIITVVRSTGFDFKKFNFEDDFDLKIDASDNEEFEFDVDIDTDSFKRNIKRNIRTAKYVYKENKLTILLVISIIISIVCIIIYINSGVYNKVYKIGDTFRTNYFSFGVTGAYITSKDYHDNEITSDRLVVVKVKAKNMSKYDLKMETAKISLTNNTTAHYPNTNYQGKFIDLGNVYVNKDISKTKFDEYLLVYEIPKDYEYKKLFLKYYDSKDKTITIAIEPINLDEKEIVGTYSLKQKVILDKSIMQNTEFTIDSFEIKNRFKEEYNYCVTNNDCYNSYEYIVPTVEDNYDKALIKVSGQINFDNKISAKKMITLGEFISAYSKLKYEINGEEKTMPVTLKQVKPSKFVSNYNNYLEVYSEALKAEKITLVITIRNKVYNYNLK